MDTKRVLLQGHQELEILFIILQIISPTRLKIAQIILSVHLSFSDPSVSYFARAAILSC